MAKSPKTEAIKGKGVADGCAKIFLWSFFLGIFFFFLWGIILTGGYGYFDQHQPFASRTVSLLGQGKLCPNEDKEIQRTYRHANGLFRLDPSREIVGMYLEPDRTHIIAIASEGTTNENKVCVKLQKLATESLIAPFEQRWEVKWADAYKRYRNRTHSTFVRGDLKTNVEVWREFCKTDYARQTSGEWCKQTGP